MNYFSIQLLNKGMENVCALGLESAGAHFFQSVIFCLEIFQKILIFISNGCRLGIVKYYLGVQNETFT